MTEEEQNAAITDLQNRVAVLEQRLQQVLASEVPPPETITTPPDKRQS